MKPKNLKEPESPANLAKEYIVTTMIQRKLNPLCQ